MQFRIDGWVAIALTEHIFDRMLAVKVKDINGESDIFEKRVMPDVLGKGAVVIEEKMIWVLTVDAECTLYKLLVVELKLLNNGT
jgi:hypothetical protein